MNPSTNEIISYIFKILMSIGLGLFVGLERDSQKKSAGLRDVAIVTFGATIYAILALELVKLGCSRYDIGRIFAYAIVSIGFLGSGVIIHQKNKLEGITTASILWSMVGTGLLIGLGNYSLACMTALSLYFLLKLKYIRIKLRKGVRNVRKNNKKRKRT